MRILTIPVAVVAFVAMMPVPPASAHPFGCRAHQVSSPATLWTHADPDAPGVLQPSIPATYPYAALVAPMPADDGPTPQFVWKLPTGPTTTFAPVVFTGPQFLGCGSTAYTGQLLVRADNFYQAYVNGVLVASCGPPSPIAPTGVDPICFTQFQTVNVTITTAAPNQLVILNWNATVGDSDPRTNPAMIQYRLDY